jgi:hypothetical protein
MQEQKLGDLPCWVRFTLRSRFDPCLAKSIEGLSVAAWISESRVGK